MRRYAVVLGLLAGLALAPTAHAVERPFTMRAGPYKLARYETAFPKEMIATPRASGWVTEFHARLVHADGSPVPVNEAMLHHLFVRNRSRARVPSCGQSPAEPFYGTGEEDEKLDLPDGYGYRLRKHDRWQLGAMIMSHRYQRSSLYLEYSGKVETDRVLTGVRPFWLHANGCPAPSSYQVYGGGGPGSVSDRTLHWPVPMSGRIVAAGGHLHAGALGLQLRDPGCGNRLLVDATPFYAPPDDLMYTATPRLHEAGPVQTSWFSSAQGIPVTKGQVLDLHGLYENHEARQLVMAIAHVYIAAGPPAAAPCAPLPADRRQTPMRPGLRAHAPYEPIPLYKLDGRHQAVRLAQPEGPVTTLSTGGAIDLSGYRFQPARVVVKAGTTITWRFRDVADHNIIQGSGPRAAAGFYGNRGDRFPETYTVPGRYQFFCALHPMTMHEQIDVVP